MITVSKKVNDGEELDRLMNTEDLVFVKALPLNENQINSENLDEYSDLDEIFHSFNIDLMFTLEAMTTQFVTEPVEEPNLGEIGEISGLSNQIQKKNNTNSAFENSPDEEEEKSQKSDLIELSHQSFTQTREKQSKKIKERMKKKKSMVKKKDSESGKTSSKLIGDQSYSVDHEQEHPEIQNQNVKKSMPSFRPAQQVGRIHQKEEPDDESIKINKNSNSSKLGLSFEKPQIEKFKKSLHDSVSILKII